MTRYSRTNETLRPSDIRNAGPHSFFDNCILIGNFSRQDWRDWTVFDCDFSSVTRLPPASNLTYIYSRGTTWPVGSIPDDIPLHNPDLSAALYRQKAQSESGLNQTLLIGLADKSADYSLSVENMYRLQSVEHGVSYADLKARYDAVFSGSSRLLKAATRIPKRPGAVGIRTFPGDRAAIRVMFGRGPTRTVDIRPQWVTAEKDRWVIARSLEAAHPGILFWVWTLDPLSIAAVDTTMLSPLPDDFWWELLGRKQS